MSSSDHQEETAKDSQNQVLGNRELRQEYRNLIAAAESTFSILISR